ncbi:MAG: helix-turn-helix transcriptional regulator [Ignavibacteriae bacterium]|nr:helix-turn-helix transcriptional regulator [Ignavibacteriota bacterium]
MKSHGKSRQVQASTLHIKNMVCNRCIKVVRDELQSLGLHVRSVALGEAVLAESEDAVDHARVRDVLEQNGFELIEDRRITTIEKIKHAILKYVQNDHDQNPIKGTPSQFIAREIGQEYGGLSMLFSSTEGVTIEQYLILQRIERAKELLKYGELTLSEISYQLGYSSVQHLSNQFKKTTGMTPSAFKRMVENTRRPVDKVAARL